MKPANGLLGSLRMLRVLCLGIPLLCLSDHLRGESAGSEAASRQANFDARIQSSVSALGSVTKVDTSAGYVFNRHWSVEFGMPFYFVRPSAAVTATNGIGSANGIGNVYGQLRLMLTGNGVGYVSTLTATAPTGNRDLGFSTGRATVDWSNYLERPISRLTPFGEIGWANSVSDTMFLIRPYTSLGFITHAQGGARIQLAGPVSFGASVYAIEPAGGQTVISRIVPAQRRPSVGRNNRRGPKEGVFETASVVTGSASIARDRGYLTWIRFEPRPAFNFHAGYTRSTQYSLDSVFFGVGLNLAGMFWRGGI